MTTRKTAGKEKKQKHIPLIQFIRFRLAKTKEKVEELNWKYMQKELRKEKRILRRLVRKRKITNENGADYFKEMCERRLGGAHWSDVRKHSVKARDVAFKIAMKHKKGKRDEGKVQNVIANMAGYHDVGKTLIAQYLVNREEGTWFGWGSGERLLDPETEFPVLRHSHVEAGMELLKIYKEFIDKDEYFLMKLLIGAHHVAYNGKGSVMAPSYPDRINRAQVSEHIDMNDGAVVYNHFPDVVKIIRTADVFSATWENRKYLRKSERITEKAKVKGISKDDAALTLCIAVAGIDTDPEIVARLFTAIYDIDFNKAENVVNKLACNIPGLLDIPEKDQDWALGKVYPDPLFQEAKKKGNDSWRKKVDTGLFRKVEAPS